MFTVKLDIENPYADLLKNAVALQFPQSARLDRCQVMEAVVGEIIASSKIRFGPSPVPEGIVFLRDIVCTAIKRDEPVRILVPWGSKKTRGDGTLDIAEIMALKMLNYLNERVKRYYNPGIEISLRTEDIGGYWLFQDEERRSLVESTEKYCSNLEALIRVLGLKFVTTVRESTLTTEENYNEVARKIEEPLFNYLLNSSGKDEYPNCKYYEQLRLLGWKGYIPAKQREYYYSTYRRIYRENNHQQHVLRLARYFAGSYARYQCNALGIPLNWNKWFQLNFANPVPGSPIDMMKKIVNYRTIHAKYSRDHMPPWRGRGYFRIHNDNTVTPAIIGWTHDINLLYENMVLEGDDGTQVNIKTNYIIWE